MTERLVDVLNANKNVLHTFPIEVGRSSSGIKPEDAEYEGKALQAAAQARLVPDAELRTLTARMHVSRSGSLEPYGDGRSVLSETREGLDSIVRERAYLLWQADGSPDGRAEEYWLRAQEQHLRERSTVLWQQEGCPADRSDEFRQRLQDFESH